MTNSVLINQGKATQSHPSGDINKILIANIGANNYFETVYIDENMNHLSQTRFSFDAVVKQENPNTLILIGTRKSFWDQVVDWYATNDNPDSLEKVTVEKLVKKDIECQIGPRIFYKPLAIDEKGLSKVEQYIEKMGHFHNVKIILVPNGVKKEEQEAYFEKLRKGIEDVTDRDNNKKTEVIYDVSNGFRSMPLYIMMLVRYFDLLKGHNFDFKAYYGNYEIKREYGDKAPLVNLTIVPKMTDWINALHDFLQYGSVKTLCQCLYKETDSDGKIKEMIDEFTRFENAMNSNNLYFLMRGIVYITGEQRLSTSLEGDYKVLDIKTMSLSEQARLMIQEIQKSYRERFLSDEIHTPEWHTPEAYLIEKMAELHTDLGNYGDAAIAFQEGLVTYVMENHLRNYFTEAYGLGTLGAFYDFLHVYENRNAVKQHYDSKLNDLKNKNLPYNKFEQTYFEIKDNIRNAKAHFRSDKDDVVTVAEMERWLRHNVRVLLKEMKRIELPSEDSSQLEQRFSDYETRHQKAQQRQGNLANTKKKFFKKIFIQTFSGTFTLRSKKEWSNDSVKEYMHALNISDEKFSTWYQQLSDCGKEGINPSNCSNVTEDLHHKNRLLAAQTYGEWVDSGLAATGVLNVDGYLNTLHQDERLKRKLLSVLQEDTPQ